MVSLKERLETNAHARGEVTGGEWWRGGSGDIYKARGAGDGGRSTLSNNECKIRPN